jgi:LppX_LprAFG lipoprotein
MRWLLALPVLAAAACLSACSASTTLDPVASAATDSSNASTVHVSATISETGATPKPVNISISGDVDNTAKTSEFDLDLSSLAGLIPGADASGLHATEVTDGSVVYLKLPALAQLLPSVNPWVKLDLVALAKSNGIDLSQLTQTTSIDPADQLELLKQASRDFTKVGDEQVNGVEATHYHGSVDLAKAVDQLDPAAKAKLEPLLGQLGTTTVPYDVWVGSDGLISRISIDMQETVPGVADGVHVAVTMDFSGYGEQVTVTDPPSDEVTDLTSLIPAGTHQ